MLDDTLHRTTRTSAPRWPRQLPAGRSSEGTICMDVPRTEICRPSRCHVNARQRESQKQAVLAGAQLEKIQLLCIYYYYYYYYYYCYYYYYYYYY
jgi:hypothetical protein